MAKGTIPRRRANFFGKGDGDDPSDPTESTDHVVEEVYTGRTPRVKSGPGCFFLSRASYLMEVEILINPDFQPPLGDPNPCR